MYKQSEVTSNYVYAIDWSFDLLMEIFYVRSQYLLPNLKKECFSIFSHFFPGKVVLVTQGLAAKKKPCKFYINQAEKIWRFVLNS